MITREQIPDVLGHTAYDPAHKKLGQIGQVYVDDVTGQPEWITVRTGLFGTKETFVPVEPAELRDDEVVVPFQQDQIKDAPTVEAEGGHLAPEQEAQLYEYYGMRYQPYAGPEPGREGTLTETPEMPAATEMPPGPATGMPPEGLPAEGMATERPTDDAMTRSEERLRVGKEEREVGRARLRKYVVTDYEQQAVPVRREEVRVEREPITDENVDQAMAGPDISEAEHEVVLHEERPVVAKETVPVERVRLEKEEVTEEEIVGEEVRRERIEAEGTETGGMTGGTSEEEDLR
jgi:uncharacterized protein (TIGR02271 family)